MTPNGTTETTAIATRPGMVMRQEFGVSQSQQMAETAANAVAAREAAAINARYIVAERHPRNIEDFRLALEKECERPTFAAVAIYRKPVGRKQNDAGQWVEDVKEGPSIRFIETALRCYRNVYPEVATVYDGADFRILRVTVTDLEANLSYTTEVTVRKEVERKGKKSRNGKIEPPEGRDILGERLNSYGDPVYLVRATEDEILIKQNALLSKAIRTNGQRLLPGDIVEECVRIIKKTQADRDAKDPDAAKRALLDAFDEFGVKPADIQAYLGHPLDRIQPAEFQRLRSVYTSIKEGESSWRDIMEAEAATGTVEQQDELAERKIADLKKKAETTAAPTTPTKTEEAKPAVKQESAPAPAGGESPAPSEEEMRAGDPEYQKAVTEQTAAKPVFGGFGKGKK